MTKLAITHQTSDFYGPPLPNHKLTSLTPPHSIVLPLPNNGPSTRPRWPFLKFFAAPLISGFLQLPWRIWKLPPPLLFVVNLLSMYVCFGYYCYYWVSIYIICTRL